MPTPPQTCLLSAADLAAAPEVHVRHPLNPNSDVYLRSLGRPVGLKRLSLSLARVPPGKESFIYHTHMRDEEFLYILSGRGRAEIGDAVIEVGPGDFMGFTAPSPAHHLLNPYDQDLVYLMGGEQSGFDIGVFPRAGKRVLFAGDEIRMIDEAAFQPMSFADYLPDGLPEAIRKMMAESKEK
jgi:uncharacterized cupin superfamily protein